MALSDSDGKAALRGFLDRQQRSVLSAIGAGKWLDEAFDFQRWNRELAQDLRCDVAQAGKVNNDIFATLQGALDVDRGVPAARAAYGYLIANLSTLDPEADLMRTGGTGDHTVYKLFNSDMDLLYVGITSRGPQRLVEHHRRKLWFRSVAHVLFEKYETRSESAHREAHLIRRHQPLHNIQHNQGQRRGRFSERAIPQAAHLV